MSVERKFGRKLILLPHQIGWDDAGKPIFSPHWIFQLGSRAPNGKIVSSIHQDTGLINTTYTITTTEGSQAYEWKTFTNPINATFEQDNGDEEY